MLALFATNGTKHAQPVGDRIKIAATVDSPAFEAVDLTDQPAAAGGANVDDRLDLKAVTPLRRSQVGGGEVQALEISPPKRVVAVAQIAEFGTE